MTVEQVMAIMLQQVPDDIDKEEGSIIWHALGPVAAMVAEWFVFDDHTLDSSIPDNEFCAGDALTRKCAEHGVNRYPANHAVRQGLFTDFNGNPADVDIGERFAAEGISYRVIEKRTVGDYKLECEEPGIVGNNYFGAILPIGNHQLGASTLGEVLTPGRDQESDAALQLRFYIEVNQFPFGGNIDQWEQWFRERDGIGNCMVFPTPNNQGGRVHAVLVAPENKPLSDSFLRELEEEIDPEPKGEGRGVAPIGQNVTLSTVEETQIHVVSTVQLKRGYSREAVQLEAEPVIESYLQEISFVDNVIRIAHVESAILAIEGVEDVLYGSTTVNGGTANITLPSSFELYQVPVLGSVTLREG